MSVNDQIILDQVVNQKRSELAPAISLSDFFEVFVAEQVLKDYDLSYEEIDAGIVGEGGDGGIDAIYAFANGELIQEDFDYSALKKNVILDVVIIQAKLSKGFSEAAIDKLIAVSEDLLNLSKLVENYEAVYNDALRSAIASFRRVFEGLAARFPTLRFRFVYATLGEHVHPNVLRKSDILREKIIGLFSAATYSFEFLGASELLHLARRPPVTAYNLSLAEIPISSTGDVGYICLVRLRDFNAFISDDRDQLRKTLFEANVRDYQGQTQVNEDIQKSLRNRTREDFWWLNNGITIVASKAIQSGKTLALEDPQIVNGLQTSTEIYNYYQTAKTDGEDRTLLVRVIVPAETESRDRIIKATNSQTSIPPASLRATDKVHRDIEEYLKPFGLFYDRRKNYYKNEGKPLDKIVGISLMAQAMMAILLQRPDTARARPSSLLKSNEDYDKLFASGHPIEIYRICITIVRRVEAYLREQQELSPKDRNNLRFYISMHLSACLCNRDIPSIDDICRISIDAIKDDLIRESFDVIKSIYDELGASDQAAKGPTLLEMVKKDIAKRLKSK